MSEFGSTGSANHNMLKFNFLGFATSVCTAETAKLWDQSLSQRNKEVAFWAANIFVSVFSADAQPGIQEEF